MEIKQLIIESGLFIKIEVDFKRQTIITSDNNSQGKTTLVRFLFYALAFDVPSTKKVNMGDYMTTISFENKNKIKQVVRKQNAFKIIYEDLTEQRFNLAIEKETQIALSLIFNTNNSEVIKNILAVLYIDQDNSWSVITNGTVIGKNKLNTMNLIAAMGEVDLDDINFQIGKKEAEIQKYNALLKLVSIKDTFNEIETGEKDEGFKERTSLLLLEADLKQQINYINIKITSLRSILNDNKKMIKYLTDYKLRIKNLTGDDFLLTAENVVDFAANQNIIQYQINEETINKKELEKSLAKVRNELSLYANLFDTKMETSEVLNSIILSGLDSIKIQRIIESSKSEKKELEQRKIRLILQKEEVLQKVDRQVKDISEELGVYKDYVAVERDLLSMRRNDKFSGAILHKIAFSYRLALNIVVSEYLNIKLPFVIDSPGSAELTFESIEQVVNAAKKHLPNSQIIISTIHKDIVNLFDENTKAINLEKLLLDYDNL